MSNANFLKKRKPFYTVGTFIHRGGCNKMSTRVSLIFPYKIGKDVQVCEKLMQIIRAILDPKTNIHTSNLRPVLVVDKDTIYNGWYGIFENYLEKKGEGGLLGKLDIRKVWAVDTCQRWLEGFNTIIEDKEGDPTDDTAYVLQIPGDLKDVHGDFADFIDRLSTLKAWIEADMYDFVIGDFDVEPEKSKHLIDMYGTYPLLFNWFPEIARKLREDRIKRPRSEFFAVSIDFLKKILLERKFAYEQTLAFLIHALSDKENKWSIKRHYIGKISDYEVNRGFREANDQIERTERLLKFLWREKNGKDSFNVKEFERLDRRSTAIREAAIVSLENFLKT
jgi:hypothetical protein